MSGPLDVLVADGVIDEVLGRLKSGKEADISLVRRGEDIIAAKVYKDRATRSFKNNADYKEGRKVRNSRTQRAMDSGGKFGRDSAEEAWKSAEADALFKLANGGGVRVPAPVLFYEGVLLMEVVRDADGNPAQRLIDVRIAADAALAIYADLCAQIISMLCCDLIHGDLSPYNILAGADGPTIIDFPQVVSAAHSSRAEFFFMRDFDNVVRFMSGFDPALAVHRADGRAIWRAYTSNELTPQFVPPPPPPPRPTRGPDRRGPVMSRGGQSQQQPRGGGPPQPRGGGPPQPRGGGPQAQPPRGGQPPQQQQPRGGGQPPQQQQPRGGGQPPQQQQPRGGGPQQQQQQQQQRGGAQPSQQPRGGGPARAPYPHPGGGGGGQMPRAPQPQRAAPSGWSESRPSSGGPPAGVKRGGRRRPKRHW